MKSVVLTALALALMPSAALGQDKTGTDESSMVQPGRHVLDSGELAADFPCAPKQAEDGPTVGQDGLKCVFNGLTYYLATAPSKASKDEGRVFGTYEFNLNGARESEQTDRIVEGDYKGLRIFDAWKKNTGPVGRVRMIELSDSVMGFALVLETAPEEVASKGEEREAAVAQAEAFIASVEVLTK